jgi:hypothetical protein
MLVSEILQKLPATLDWMVLFNLSSLRQLGDDSLIKAMFFLPAETPLEAYSHVILSSQGHLLAPLTGSRLDIVEEGQIRAWSPTLAETLAERFPRQLAQFPVDQADCLGLGEQAPFPPVLLYLQLKDGYGEAQALFSRSPDQRHYELLPAVGVKFLGGCQRGSDYLARFHNCLPTHLQAGMLAHFTRTAHCNLFFLQHGQIDSKLAIGLALAARDRIAAARARSLAVLARLVRQACQEPLAMTCQPPLAQPVPFGDLVPLGFLLYALNTVLAASDRTGRSVPAMGEADQANLTEAAEAVRQLLLAKRQGPLWAFHTGRLVTSTDSALILQGMADKESLEALEIFADGQGGYYPQLWVEADQAIEVSETAAVFPGRMAIDQSNRHWCQADYATTCLVSTLRHSHGLPAKTPLAYLAAGFETRSGLYFANPYLVDWVLARALQGRAEAAALREQLLAELLASMNEDYSFGQYDLALSTALAILSLAALGYRGQFIRLAQLRLLDFQEAEGVWPETTPFYSSQFFDHTRIPAAYLFNLLLNDRGRQLVQIGDDYHALTFYRDTHRIIGTALASLALSERCEQALGSGSVPQRLADAHPRYRYRSQAEYIANFALPPYLEGQTQLKEQTVR